jgi:hypothetical protein
MTPKDKATEIYQKMLGDDGSTHPKVFGGVKRCALIAIDEIIKCLDSLNQYTTMDYYIEVKQEIEKL